MIDGVETSLRKILLDEHGIAATKITSDARIVHDLGIDGDDAVELFRDLFVAFGTDFSALDQQWGTFFSTEGASPRAISTGIPSVILCGGVAGVVVGLLRWPIWIGMGLALALFVGGAWLFSKWFGKELQPVTVGGLTEIILTGKWPDDPVCVR